MSKSIDQINSLITKAVRTAKTDRELAVKGLNFGRLWNEVGEYEKASKWLTKYLVIYDKDSKAHKLLGEIYEKLDRSDAALSCYKNSLRVKPQQYELMLKVAEMHINPGPTQNPGRAQVWLDKAAVALPNNPQVYKLKMELYLAQEAPPSKLEDTILEELRKRPADPSLHVQYVTFLKDQERLEEAFAYALKTDHSSSIPKAVERDLEWNQCLIDTCQEYAERMCDDEVTTEGIKAYSLLLISLSRSIWLCFEQEKYEEALENLAMLDTSVFSALGLGQETTESGGQGWNAVLNESKGQLYWLSGIALIHLAMQDELQWSQATKSAAACFAVCLSFPAVDVSETWASWSRDATFGERLKVMGGFRLSQSAHMMRNLATTSHSEHSEEKEVNEREWLREVTDNYCTDEGRRKVFNHLFGRNYNPETSMIYTEENFSEVTAQFVTEECLNDYDTIAAVGVDLQTWVWMGLQWRQNYENALDPFTWISAVFSDLQLAPSSSVIYGNIWNLNRLDIEAFIVACVCYAEKASRLWQNSKLNTDKDGLGPAQLPLPLCKRLVTDRQSNWWDAACKLHCKKSREKIFNPNQVKATLRHGIEAIRGSGNHGLQLMLITCLAKHFSAKAYTIDKSGMGTSSSAWLAYQRRAAHYWMLALPMLQDVTNNRIRRQTEPKDRLFPTTLNHPTVQEARSMISEVYMCNGGLLVQEGDLKRALETYGKADTPHASFCEALIYKQLVENCDKEESSITGSNSKKKEAYMRKYSARLEVTLNRLQRDPDEELLRRTESLLHAHISSSPSTIRTSRNDAESKRLFEETIPKHTPHVANHTVNSEVDDSVLAIPSKQSTPKSEMKSDSLAIDKNTMVQLAQNLTTLTSALSTMQINFNERLNKMEQTRSPKRDQENKDQVALENVCTQLAKLTTIVSGLQERKEDSSEQTKRMQQQIEQLKEQVSRSQLGTPVAPSRVVQLTQQDGMVQPSALQVFDQYQQASLGQLGSPMPPGSPYYGVPQYQGYLPHSPAVAAMYAQQGYALPPTMVPQYGQPRMPQQVVDPRAVPSPVRTPPIHVRPQAAPNTGLPMSKEAADALSMRFQAAMGGTTSPTGLTHPMSPGLKPAAVPGHRPGVPLAQSTSQPTSTALPVYNQKNYAGSTALTNQGHLTQSQSEPTIRNGQSLSHIYGHGEPQKLQSNSPSETQKFGLDESYLPPSVTNTAQGQGGTSVLKSLLASGTSPLSSEQAAQPEIHYPEHIHFPEKKNVTAPASTEWSFKFQSPEEMDRANKKLEADEEAEDAETSHNDSGPHFEPLVSLPEVEVRTGEEEEVAVFSDRAKLYRWHEGQWKERGLGVMKILKHKETGKYRLLMRRDQVLKICCNHIIGKDLDLQPMPKTDKAWVWHAMDFSEEEGKQEALAIRFKTAEIANSFREKFLLGQRENNKLSGGTPARPTPKTPANSSIFGQSVSSVASSTSTPNTAVKPALSDSTVPKFMFSFPKPSAAAKDLAARIAGTVPKETEKPGKDEEEKDTQEEDAHNESGDGPHFEPIIKLPDKVETKTGEEDEEIRFCYRAKLYRFTENQWKERGVGDIKILHNKETNKCRIVMRREQVLKLCANHYITSEMNLAPHANSAKAWTWTAFDHSDPDTQPKQELLAVRFKLEETAAEFAKIFKEAKDIMQGKAVSTSTKADASETKTSSHTSVSIALPVVSLPSFTTASNEYLSAASLAKIDLQETTNVSVKTTLSAWDCPTCYSPNLATELKCPCCFEPNPAAPKICIAQSSAPSSKPTFSFGVPSSTTATFSFGVKLSPGSAAPPSQTTKPVFGIQPVATKVEEIPKTSSGQISTTGPLTVKKQPGKWNCSDCYAENEATDTKCPCCGNPNPKAPPESKMEDAGTKSGPFSFSTNQKFSFGIPAKSNENTTVHEEVKATSSIVSPPKFTFGIPVSSGKPFSFGLNPSFGASGTGTTQPSPSLFSDLGSQLSKSSVPSGDVAKPRFPSVGDGEEEDEEDSEATTASSNETTDEEEDDYDEQAAFDGRYRSPLSRPPKDDDDVVCLGEVLPSEELQQKAQNLLLPKHFYNFVKEGEETEDSQTEDEQPGVMVPAPATIQASKTTETSTTTSTFGFAAAATSSFADLVKANASGGHAFGGGSGGWVGMTDQKPLFANLAQHDTSIDGNDYYKSEENDNIHFEPVVKLPEKVETVTGEEDDETLFSQRCKLYRYNQPTNEWKERGLGDIKMLRNRKTGRIRILMRREQVLKVCANHYIRPGMTLDPNKTSDRAWTWTAMDFSDADNSEPRHEIFTAKFKNPEIANEFKENFEKCQTMLLDADPMTPCKASTLRTQELQARAEKMKSELRYFKDKFSEPTKVDLEHTLTDETSDIEQKPTPPVGSLTPLVEQHAQSLRKTMMDKDEGSIIETPQKHRQPLIGDDNKFSFQLKTTDEDSKPKREHTVSASSDDPQAERDVHFEPIVQLPEKVDLVTGEEDEQVLFGSRAKLYSYHKESVQWKERGLGDIKILQHTTTFKVRVVMRREQVFKVCLNHSVQPEIKLTYKDPNVPKTVLWTATDFSDEEKPDGEILQFALRFKDSETAGTFKRLWEEGGEASSSNTLLEPDPSAINTSTLTAGATSPVQTAQSPQSPESPVKHPASTFSFANVPSPFDEAKKTSHEGPVNVMGFVFGKQPEKSTTSTPTLEKFKFDVSKMSFNFGSTSTPQGTVGSTPSNTFFTPPQSLPSSKTNASKTLFPAESSDSADSNLYLTSSETFTQSNLFSGGQNNAVQPKSNDQSPLFLSGQTFGTAGKEYKPSPLAMMSNFSSAGTAFSVQSGKYQFKPVSGEMSQKTTDQKQDSEDGNDDVVFVSELIPTDDQRERAQKLFLPLTFFLFENKPFPPNYDEKVEDRNEDKIIKFLEDRNSGKIKLDKQSAKDPPAPANVEEVAKKSESTDADAGRWVFGGGIQEASNVTGFASFAALSSGVQNIGFKKDPSFQFPGAGQVMFQPSEGSEDHDPSSFKCEAQFKPVLEELPPLVEVKTGEEGEEILFKERCKLFRYDKDKKEWKERGVGEIKILRNDEYNLHRVVMRRDQVFKVCINHVINETTNPEFHLGATKTCSYFVMDYSESKTPTAERVAIRFSKEDICKQYMDQIAEIKALQETAS